MGSQPPKRRTAPVFGPCLLWPNGWMDEDATSYGSRARPRPYIVLDVRGPSYPPPRERAQQPPIFGPCLLWPHSPISAAAELLLANVFAICYRPSVCLSSVCNARAPYSGGSNFPQYFYGIWYLGHPLTSTENFTEIVPGEPLRRGS